VRAPRDVGKTGIDVSDLRAILEDIGTATTCHDVDYDDCAEANFSVHVHRRKQRRSAALLD
jgi:hypothetical protein